MNLQRRPNMRCKCCNKILSDQEARLKDRYGQYEDMCIPCLKLSYIPVDEEENDEEDDLDFDSDWD